MPAKDRFEEARKEMRRFIKKESRIDKTEFCLGIADAVGGAVDSAKGLEGLHSLGALSAFASLYKALKEDVKDVLPNPNFSFNGQDDGDSPATAAYFTGRYFKNAGGAAFNLIGVAAAGSTAGINVASVIQHGNASGSTLAHLTKLDAIAERGRFKEATAIQDWLTLCTLAKQMKLAVRTTSLVGACIPAAGLATGILTAVAKVGIKLTFAKIIYATAMEIHWRAFLEQRITGFLTDKAAAFGQNAGPASMIFWEIFTKRNLTRIFGKYPIMQLVQEPAGWLALADKLMLI
jgi:hypothetical protein